MAAENVYANVPRTRQNKGFEVEAPQRRSKVTLERVALVVLCVLLLAAASVVIGVLMHNNSTSRNSTEAMTEMATIAGPPCVFQCDKNWVFHGKKCYYFSPKNIKLPWTSSRDRCRSLDGDLVKIKSREQQKFVFKLDDQFWIGLTDSETEGLWKWTDGSPLNQSLTFWSTEPDDWKGYNNDFPEGEDCAIIVSQNGFSEKNSWADVYCGHQQRFICDKELTCKKG